ncbi:MAG: hypothetical protein ACKVVT_13230 [Dehalococcoidia bacterium]
MNDEQTKRLADAADAFWQARELLAEAVEATCAAGFDGAERERVSAGQVMLNRLEAAIKRNDDALKKAAIAAAACGRPGAWDRIKAGIEQLRSARKAAGEARDADGSLNKREKAKQAISALEEALDAMQQLVFAPAA